MAPPGRRPWWRGGWRGCLERGSGLQKRSKRATGCDLRDRSPERSPEQGCRGVAGGAASRTRLGPEDTPPSVSGDPFSSLLFTSFWLVGCLTWPFPGPENLPPDVFWATWLPDFTF